MSDRWTGKHDPHVPMKERLEHAQHQTLPLSIPYTAKILSKSSTLTPGLTTTLMLNRRAQYLPFGLYRGYTQIRSIRSRVQILPTTVRNTCNQEMGHRMDGQPRGKLSPRHD